MRSREIARRYAEALHALACERGNAEQVESEYQQILLDVAEIPKFKRFLVHPLIPREKKDQLVNRAFPGISESLQNLFRLLIRNGRGGYLDVIFKEFLALRAEEEGVIRVQIATAQATSSEEQDRLTERLTQALGRRVVLVERLEPALLGGVRLEVDGKVIDGTLQAKLEGLRALLEG